MMKELKASIVNESKIKNIMQSGVLNTPPSGATHYDMFWCTFLKVSGDVLSHYEDCMWKVSNHKDGIEMVANGECVNLWTDNIEPEIK